jgi:hypothetical protein
MRRLRAIVSVGVLSSVGIVAIACGGGEGQPSSSSSPSAANVQQFMTMDTASQSVTFKVIGAYDNTSSGFNFDGYSNGGLTLTAPVNWKVTIACENRGSVNHSCAVVQDANATAPAITGASTSNPTVGIAPGGSESFTFTPSTAGTFRIACLVPGHEPGGMWITFTVAASGQPSISAG